MWKLPNISIKYGCYLKVINGNLKKFVKMALKINQDGLSERINVLMNEAGMTNRRFALSVGIDPSGFDKKTKGIQTWTVNDVSKICEKMKVRKGWLLDGEGQMMKAPDEILDHIPAMPSKPNCKEGIPLIPTSAMAGALGGDSITINEWDVEDFYVIPAFKKSDFCIRVDGDSMQPKYLRGDILACTRVPLSDLWFQWGRVYVLSTRQGALVKHVEKGSDNDHITLVSDNPDYKPFEIPTSELFGLAIVNGVIRVE